MLAMHREWQGRCCAAKIAKQGSLAARHLVTPKHQLTTAHQLQDRGTLVSLARLRHDSADLPDRAVWGYYPDKVGVVAIKSRSRKIIQLLSGLFGGSANNWFKTILSGLRIHFIRFIHK